jgi:origin recognition complex subunit 2
MKRRRDLAEEADSGENERTPKKTRSGARVASSPADDDEQMELDTTPRKRRTSRRNHLLLEENSVGQEEVDEGTEIEEPADDLVENGELESDSRNHTPRKETRGRKKNTVIDVQTNGATPQKGLLEKKLFSTPVKAQDESEADTPRITRNADRSARRKSTRTLIERTVFGNTSDNDEDEEDIAQEIYGSGEDEDPDQDIYGLLNDTAEDTTVPATPSKRGRKKGTKNRQRSPTPPEDLEPHEKYFFQNRGGRPKTSNNNLSSLALLDHEEYFSRSRNLKDPHAADIDYLESIHVSSFNQWQFELSQDFNLCVYGWGSKRSLLMKFADHIYKSREENSKAHIVVVNGYVHSLTIKDVLNTVASAISSGPQKLGSQPAEMLENLISLLEEDSDQSITLIIHSLDRLPFRRPTTQTILARLSSHPQIHLVASADHPNFPLLWDNSLRSTYNFLFHDCTTFQPYTAEIDVVDEVHELLGRSGRRVGGKEGVSFVLKSLPENAKNLFRVLVGEQLAGMDDNSGALFNNDEEDNDNEPRVRNNTELGVEYRVLYQKAVEEFICSNEMNFRTLLKEFVLPSALTKLHS